MVVRIVMFQLRSEVTDYDTRVLLASINAAVKSVPGLLSFNVGQRIEGGSYAFGLPPGGVAAPADYMAMFQFESRAALVDYLKHPAQQEMRARFAAVAASAITNDYEL